VVVIIYGVYLLVICIYVVLLHCNYCYIFSVVYETVSIVGMPINFSFFIMCLSAYR